MAVSLEAEKGAAMKLNNLVWLASYPRSGNTLLRQILWHCFGLRSASVYKNDLGGNTALEEYVGHIEHNPNMHKQLEKYGVSLIKTHRLVEQNSNTPAIYVIRDGRAACVSLWKFFDGFIPLDAVIEGQHTFGTWSDHVMSWDPWNRQNTLLLEYENLSNDLPKTLKSISSFLKKEIINSEIPARNQIAEIDGRWVRRKTSWRSELSGANLERFIEINKKTLKKAGYI
jgi:hypothetical protein